MISADLAISRFRRDLTLGLIVRVTFILGALASLVVGPITGQQWGGVYIMLALGSLWVALGFRSARGSRLAAQSPGLIASGRYDEAESHIDEALRTFSIFKPVKIMSLHHLAVLRHAQHSWQDSARLCQALLSQQPSALGGLSKPSMLLLIDDLLNMGDLHGSYQVLLRLHQQPLTLLETLSLQHLQLEYCARVGAWTDLLQNVAAKVQLAEIMPTTRSARSQAYLALAAQVLGNHELAAWLRDRAALLVKPAELLTQQPFLKPLWPDEILAPVTVLPDAGAEPTQTIDAYLRQSIEGSLL